MVTGHWSQVKYKMDFYNAKRCNSPKVQSIERHITENLKHTQPKALKVVVQVIFFVFTFFATCRSVPCALGSLQLFVP